MKQSGEHGFALLVVLWSLVLVSLLTTQILASGRTAVLQADNITGAAQAEARADGAINQAIFHLLLANGAEHGPSDGTVRIRPLDDKINPNLASAALLSGLFEASGASATQAANLADAVVRWRTLADSQQAELATLAHYRQAGLSYGPPGHAFSDLSELAYVIGMPQQLLARAMPHMSLYQTGDPNPAHADPIVREALARSDQSGPSSDSSDVNEGSSSVVSIEAVAKGPGAVTVRRDAIISINSALSPMPFKYLSLTGGN